MLKKSKILKSDHGETHFNHILMKTQVAASLLKKKKKDESNLENYNCT